MDQHFKLLHADEEIMWLNVKIHRLVTFMMDEEECLQAERKEGLAIQLSHQPRFTGDSLPGVSISRERHTPVVRDRDIDMHVPSPLPSLKDPALPADDDEVDVE
ncbi:hypothetical protein C8R44DRAFT_891418 [Mycena epipterygia]|nr:hypothetical protein C8R44DRAFT_891418 [Mycena epipterygia]